MKKTSCDTVVPQLSFISGNDDVKYSFKIKQFGKEI